MNRFVTSLLAACAACVLFAEGAPGPQTPFRRKVALIAGFAEDSENATQVKRFAASYLDSHPTQFGFASKTRPGTDRFRVFDASGTVVYEGGDEREAESAVVNALTDMPVPGQLINGVALKKFKSIQRTYVMGKVKAEGAGLAPFKAALKSKKPGEAEEAQAILDSIEKAKQNLEAEIAEDLASDAKGPALRDMAWFVKTWPSEKAKYEDQLKKLMADPEAVKAAKALLAPPRRRR